MFLKLLLFFIIIYCIIIIYSKNPLNFVLDFFEDAVVFKTVKFNGKWLLADQYIS